MIRLTYWNDLQWKMLVEVSSNQTYKSCSTLIHLLTSTLEICACIYGSWPTLRVNWTTSSPREFRYHAPRHGKLDDRISESDLNTRFGLITFPSNGACSHERVIVKQMTQLLLQLWPCKSSVSYRSFIGSNPMCVGRIACNDDSVRWQFAWVCPIVMSSVYVWQPFTGIGVPPTG